MTLCGWMIETEGACYREGHHEQTQEQGPTASRMLCDWHWYELKRIQKAMEAKGARG